MATERIDVLANAEPVMSSANVLAVMAHHAHELTKKYGPDNDLAQARAAVAELIEAVNYAASFEGQQLSAGGYRVIAKRLRAALARAGGV